MRASRAVALLALLGALSARGSDPADTVFVDATASAGISFVHCLGDDAINTIVEATGSGLAWFDFDQDGWMDLYLVNGRYQEGVNDPESEYKGKKLGNRLYRNRGNGTFEDVTGKAGVADHGYGMGVVVGDFDNDGYPDLYVTNFSGNSLYHNRGNGTFEDVTAKAGVRGDRWSVGSVFLDYDLDGDLDLFVTNYLEWDPKYRLYYEADVYPGPLAYPAVASTLYRNNGDGTFTDVTAPAGLQKKGRGMGTLSADFDDDGLPDLFVANDAMENFLFHNEGKGIFREIGREAGTAFGQHGNTAASMGGDIGDVDGDGKLDLIVPAMGSIAVYRGLGGGLFDDVSALNGVARACAQFWSWGSDLFDYDNDGDLDMLVVNGDGHRLSEKQEQLLLLNSRDSTGATVFTDVSRKAGEYFDTRSVARGLATADYDNDGDIDFAVLNIDGPSLLLRNDGGNSGNWLGVQLRGTRGNRDGIGARVTVRSGDWSLTEVRMSASSYLSQNDPRLHFGLGRRAGVDDVTIRWPGGKTQTIKNPPINKLLKVTEP